LTTGIDNLLAVLKALATACYF